MKFDIFDQNGQHIDTVESRISISSNGQLQHSVTAPNGTKIYDQSFSSGTQIDIAQGISLALNWAKNHYANPNLKLIFHYP